MFSGKHHRRYKLIILFTLFLGLIVVGSQFGGTATARSGHSARPSGDPLQINVSTNISNTLYLPTVYSKYPLRSLFGVELGRIRNGTGLDMVIEAGTQWSRSGEVAWGDVQPDEGIVPDWHVLADSEQEWIIAAENDLTNIVIVDTTPDWAQAVEGYPCGPIKYEKLDDFASFMYMLVARYSQPPWHIKYWELWNEPDVAPSIVPPESSIGCWGDENDPNYGGWYYAEMLKNVYPEIKRADPNAKVLVGGLLLDCDPRSDQGCDIGYGGHGELPPKFLRGILENGGVNYFDGISFHAFDIYYYGLGLYGNLRWESSWDGSGPVLLAKLDYLNSLLAEYNVTGKTLLSTENALLWYCDNDPDTWPLPCTDPDTFEKTKAYYLAQTFAAATRERLPTNIWLSIYGWRESGLLTPDNSPLPAYDAYMFASNQLWGAEFVGDIDIPDDPVEEPWVRGFDFRSGNRRIWIIWSLDGENHTIQLLCSPTTGYHVDGEDLEPEILNGSSLTVTIEPVYLVWSPSNQEGSNITCSP